MGDLKTTPPREFSDDKSESSTRSASYTAKHNKREGLLYYTSRPSWLSSTKVLVLVILSLQNSLFTVLRRYSQGVLKETYSKYEVLLLGECIKLAVSAWMIQRSLPTTSTTDQQSSSLQARCRYLVATSHKMVGLAGIYGAMNILSFISLRNIGAGMFTIFAQCKILTTATFSTALLHRHYSPTKWRALIGLSLGVLLFTQPQWNSIINPEQGSVVIGIAAVLIEVTLSGFASIYFEKVIKTDPLQLNIWERNFQLAFGSVPVYIFFILFFHSERGLLGGWSVTALIVALLGAAGGLLVALSIKYGDAILKTLATTAAIILSSSLDYMFLHGIMTPVMIIAGAQVIISICNYTFDATVDSPELSKNSNRGVGSTTNARSSSDPEEEELPLVDRRGKNNNDS